MEGIVFLGPPGSGKGTQARLLSRSWSAPLIGMGDLLREEIQQQTPRGQQIEQDVHAGSMPRWSMVCEIFQEHLDKVNSNRIILDGIPRNTDQIPDVAKILKHKNCRIIHAFCLNVHESALIERIENRVQCAQCGLTQTITTSDRQPSCQHCHSTHFLRRNDDTKEVMVTRFQVYQASVQGLMDYYQSLGVLTILDGTTSVHDVHQLIHQRITEKSAS